jgi:thiol-disulfide isomerase/thioredoxin
MKIRPKILIAVALAASIGAVLWIKNNEDERPQTAVTEGPETVTAPESGAPATPDNMPDSAESLEPEIPAAIETASVPKEKAGTKTALPKLLDLGADKCIPCKAMAPILEELKREYAGKFEVHFIDIWKNPDAGKKYEVQMIPTQIFFDVEGKERFRHTGFFGKEDILAKWKELGVL